MGRAKECELYKLTITFDKMKEEAPVYREDLTVLKKKVTIETMEPTIFFLFGIVRISYFQVKCLEGIKNRGWGKS